MAKKASVDSAFFLVNHTFLCLKSPFFLWISMEFYGFLAVKITMHLIHLPSPHRLQKQRCGCLLWLFLSRGIPPNLLMASCWAEANHGRSENGEPAVDILARPNHKPSPSHHKSMGGMFTIPKWEVYDLVLPTLYLLNGFKNGEDDDSQMDLEVPYFQTHPCCICL